MPQGTVSVDASGLSTLSENDVSAEHSRKYASIAQFSLSNRLSCKGTSGLLHVIGSNTMIFAVLKA